MNKSELIAVVAEKNELSKAQTAAVVDTILEATIDAVAHGDGLQIVGFGNFRKATRAARIGHNPMTQKEIKIPASVVPKFTAGSKFKEAVAAAKKGKKKSRK